MNTPVWDDGNWPGLPSLEGDLEAEVCVVGLGGSGLAAIHELLRLGRSVVGLDAGPVAGGAAGRNGGFLLAGLAKFYHQSVAEHGRDFARRVYQATLDQIARMKAETPEAIRRVGSLRIAASEEELQDCTAHLEALRADGFAAEPYEGPEGQGLLIPSDGVFNPLERCRRLAQQALQAGARLFENTPALSISGRMVQTPQGRVHCQKVLVAVDGRLECLLPELKGRVRTARLQMLATAPVAMRYTRPVYRRWGYDYWQQLPDGRIALGGMRDAGGEAEWTTQAEPTEDVQQRLEALLRQLDIGAPVTHRWAASVGYTSSGLPVAEEVRPGVWAVGAYSGTGNVLGALLGREVAWALLGSRMPGAVMVR
ncbi:NAD(P)/FAD-dependent oxidoreductase [Meiothermus taiwanensis]|uniref:FAD dependent oxidoreductase n=1 Tax=Meiothermus taiwanensis WR-220 TaxID=1339250 RepID=A0ABM6WHK2_9DEIN|nr:FAD-binding oxidoreductase [Meiothermus taiwanensis]AWR86422.1 FAD dependent oxidoreductase [Meiothermus taiwanensis WR-220]KIQ54274.1 FAD-dependent oxidoreductase [Meiothermus taiwanensis]KZK16509.1 FAD-dependent oxidoreductase [Meiothermus taiwanensis]